VFYSRGADAVTVSAYDAPLSAIREHAGDVAVWLAIWDGRAEPDAHARRCASDAVDAIDAMLRDLYQTDPEIHSCHGHDPLVLDDTLAWASVRKCPLNPAVVTAAVRPSGEETRWIGPPCI
jgi:hypothetical protein